MGVVTELIDSFPVDGTVLQLKRDEDLLLTKPEPGAMKLWRDYDLLGVVHFPFTYRPAKFAPPKDVYDNEHVRVEWQQMNARQPFYHRNADVDEISFHVSGERTLLTERGSIEFREGDFGRIPVNTAHDNRGVEDVHLIFYIPAPVTECVAPSRRTEFKVPPFPGWEAKHIPEMMTECLGAIGCDRSVSLVDEMMLLEAAKAEVEPINLLRSSGSAGTEWIYKSEHVWLGTTTLLEAQGDVYKRHRRADEIQCQIKGRRTLVTQRGTVELEPGDFISIPLGTAFTDIVTDESMHISVVTRFPAEPKRECVRTAIETSPDVIKSIRNGSRTR